jgi:hypothetical protein
LTLCHVDGCPSPDGQVDPHLYAEQAGRRPSCGDVVWAHRRDVGEQEANTQRFERVSKRASQDPMFCRSVGLLHRSGDDHSHLATRISGARCHWTAVLTVRWMRGAF